MEQEGRGMTNLEWIKGMDAEQMERDILNACDYYDCERCPIKATCEGSEKGNEKAMEWLMEGHKEADG